MKIIIYIFSICILFLFSCQRNNSVSIAPSNSENQTQPQNIISPTPIDERYSFYHDNGALPYSYCDKDQNLVLYAGDCILQEDVPTTKNEELSLYANPVTQKGITANVIIEGTILFEEMDVNSKPLFAFQERIFFGKIQAKILEETQYFYKVEMRYYKGINSCGVTSDLDHIKTGYILKKLRDVPTLWSFKHMTALC